MSLEINILGRVSQSEQERYPALGNVESKHWLDRANTESARFGLSSRLGITTDIEKILLVTYLGIRFAREEQYRKKEIVKLGVLAGYDKKRIYGRMLRDLQKGVDRLDAPLGLLTDFATVAAKSPNTDLERAGTIERAVNALTTEYFTAIPATRIPRPISFNPDAATLNAWTQRWQPQLAPRQAVAASLS